MFDVTGLFTVFVILVLLVCMNLRVCVCNFNVYYLHVIYALTFMLTFMLTFASYYFLVLHAVFLDLFI